MDQYKYIFVGDDINYPDSFIDFISLPDKTNNILKINVTKLFRIVSVSNFLSSVPLAYVPHINTSQQT